MKKNKRSSLVESVCATIISLFLILLSVALTSTATCGETKYYEEDQITENNIIMDATENPAITPQGDPPKLNLFTGTVTNKFSGEPIDGAFIITDQGGAAISFRGVYDMYTIHGEEVTITARAEGYLEYSEKIVVVDGDYIVRKDIELIPIDTTTTTTIPFEEGLIIGVIRDQNTLEPIGEAVISTNDGIAAKSDDEGTFSTEHDPGTWTVEIFAEGYKLHREKVTVEQGQTIEKIFQ